MTIQEKRHERYIANADRLKAYARAYYSEHKDYHKAKRKLWEQRQREIALSQRVTRRVVTTKDYEDALPDYLKQRIDKLRKEYLIIHITERPPYEQFLLTKTKQYQQKKI